jgi:hypothetical protein
VRLAVKGKGKLGMVLHVCNPSYLVGVGERIVVQGWLRHKCEKYLNKCEK